MKIELRVNGLRTAAVLKGMIDAYVEAYDADDADEQTRFLSRRPVERVEAGNVPQIPMGDEPKAKRGRKAAAEKEPAPAPEPVAEEPEPAIRATPEDRQPVAEVEQIEEAEVVASSAPPSLDDLKAAMAKVQEVRGMDWLVKNVQTLLGAPRASAVADEDRAAAIARLEEAARG